MTESIKTDAAVQNTGAEYSIPYLLTQIAVIQNDTSYIHQVLSSLTEFLTSQKSDYAREINLGPGAVMADDPRFQAADAIKHTILARETTNQKILGVYEKLLDHLIASSGEDDASDGIPF